MIQPLSLDPSPWRWHEDHDTTSGAVPVEAARRSDDDDGCRGGDTKIESYSPLQLERS